VKTHRKTLLSLLTILTLGLTLFIGACTPVIYGVPEEHWKRMDEAERAAARAAYEERRRQRYRVDFNPASLLLALEEFTANAGVQLLYDSRVCAVHVDDSRIQHLVIENKSGRSAIACRTVVDATGDADVCFLAGEQTESLDTNVLCGWFYTMNDGKLQLHQLSNRYSPQARKDDAAGPFFRGDTAEHVTAHVIGTRSLIRAELETLRTRAAPLSDVQIVSVPTTACLRMTRRLTGSFSLGARHVHQWFDDTVGLTGDWRESGPVYAVPLRALRGVATRNLLAAGRCISVDTTVWDATRAIPTCVLTGEAAGTAAAMAADTLNGDVHSLTVAVLQNQLRRQGVFLDPTLVALADEQ